MNTKGFATDLSPRELSHDPISVVQTGSAVPSLRLRIDRRRSALLLLFINDASYYFVSTGCAAAPWGTCLLAGMTSSARPRSIISFAEMNHFIPWAIFA